MAIWLKLGLVAVFGAAVLVGVMAQRNTPILIEDARAMSHGGALIGVTMTIRNTSEPDSLVSAEVPGAKMAIVKGENAQPLPIPARSTVALAMDGAHIMLGGVPGPMRDGLLIPINLTFTGAGDINAKVRYVEAAAMGEGMDHAAMMAAEYAVPPDEPTPTITLSAAPLSQGGYEIAVETTGFAFARDMADGPHEPGFGHGHLYAGGVKLGRVYDNRVTVPPLPEGTHLVRVTLNTNDHRTYVVDGKPVTATVEVGR